jgi:hypothetical protein
VFFEIYTPYPFVLGFDLFTLKNEVKKESFFLEETGISVPFFK